MTHIHASNDHRDIKPTDDRCRRTRLRSETANCVCYYDLHHAKIIISFDPKAKDRHRFADSQTTTEITSKITVRTIVSFNRVEVAYRNTVIKIKLIIVGTRGFGRHTGRGRGNTAETRGRAAAVEFSGRRRDTDCVRGVRGFSPARKNHRIGAVAFRRRA